MGCGQLAWPQAKVAEVGDCGAAPGRWVAPDVGRTKCRLAAPIRESRADSASQRSSGGRRPLCRRSNTGPNLRQHGVMTTTGGSRAEAFLQWADELAGGMEARYQLFEEGGRPAITSIWYGDRPSAGWGVGLTYGASLLPGSRIELAIVVQSHDPVWVWALAHFVDSHRADVGELGVDDTINWHEPIAPDSGMDALFVGPPVGLPSNEGIVHLGSGDHIQILQAFPAYAVELTVVRDLGGNELLARAGEDALDPRRPPVT